MMKMIKILLDKLQWLKIPSSNVTMMNIWKKNAHFQIMQITMITEDLIQNLLQTKRLSILKITLIVSQIQMVSIVLNLKIATNK